MDERIKKQVDEMLLEDLKDVNTMDFGTEERKAAVDQIEKMYKLRQEDEKLEESKMAREEQEKVQAIVEGTKLIEHLVESALSMLAVGGFLSTILKFEETGSIAAAGSRLGLNLVTRLFKTK